MIENKIDKEKARVHLENLRRESGRKNIANNYFGDVNRISKL